MSTRTPTSSTPTSANVTPESASTPTTAPLAGTRSSMRAVLSTQLPVEKVAVFAEMAWLERRPELGLLCQSAQKEGGRLSAKVVQSALPGIADAGARNVLEWCRTLGLSDKQGALTRLGEVVAETMDAPVPEQGVYSLWLARHALLGSRILSVERLSSTRDQRFEDVKPLPFEPDQGVVFRSIADPTQRFMLRDLPSNHEEVGCLIGTTKARCTLQWTLDFEGGTDQWQLEGSIEAGQGMKPIQHRAETTGINLWDLAKSWGTGPLASFGRWQPTLRRLEVAFEGLTEPEQEHFRKSFVLPRADVPGKGTFADVTLEHVPIGPATAEDATRWAFKRLTRVLARSRTYRSRLELRRLFLSLTEGTPLEAHQPTLPAHEKLMKGLVTTPELYWSLAAPVDLAPHPVPAIELDAITVGGPEPTVESNVPGAFYVPYRSHRSMQSWVEGILQGSIPRRILLYDKYVRGQENLTMLELLVKTLRGFNPQVQVEVWTQLQAGNPSQDGNQKDAADPKRLQEITGRQPQDIATVFGRSTPHDRFLVILPTQGEGFGWNMSNSPLHVRCDVTIPSPETQLRWHGLASVRLSQEELPKRLGQWLSGGGK